MKRKIIIFFSVVFILFMAGLFVFYLVKHDSSRWQVALGGIFASALPLLLLKGPDNPFNVPAIISYYLFLICSLFLGSISSFYLHYKWWDSTLHFFKALYVGAIGITLYKLFIPAHVRNDVSKWIIFLFVLSLGVLSSVLWEIYEFLGDMTFTHTMQRGGNKDTMYDLLCGLGGSLMIAIYSLIRKPKV
ncbi:membrane-spanning protein [Neobacillus muris]|uniref:membrane-spanning protein n=1 Tax=Neobacillus muris TaxID=2941334 RepID=UPI00203C0421|nr:membrane-spanning protein [Neobacillus muris]